MTLVFNTSDGAAFSKIRKLQLETAIITRNRLKSLVHRAKDLKIGHLVQHSKDKAEDLQKICYDLKIKPHEAVYIGNDDSDVACMSIAGYSFAPADAEEKAKQAAHFILKRKGGEGVVREFVEEFLLKPSGFHNKE